jgi:prolyl 4-hydroxylase
MTQITELERRAKTGDLACQVALARLYEGEGENERAREWFARAAERGDSTALLSLAKNLLVRSPIRAQQGVNLVRTAAERGDAEALHICAVIASQDINLPSRWAAALDYLRRSAESGSSLARRQLQLLAAVDVAHQHSNWATLARDVNMSRWLSPPPSRAVFETPRIVCSEGFASSAECDWLISRARPHLKAAEVYDPVHQGGTRIEHVRNNRDMSFDIVQSDLILMALRERIAKLASLGGESFEPTMILNYAPGQRFAPHFDFVDATSAHLQNDIAKNGQRVATFLLYLNDDFAGGETDFPTLGWRFKGAKGDAVLFYNVDSYGQPDLRTLHAGLEPSSGEKWVLSQWLRAHVLATAN